MVEHYGHFIGGKTMGQHAASMPLMSPASEQCIAQTAMGTAADVDHAVSLAHAQLYGGPWGRLSGAERGRLLNRLADLVERDLERIADMDAACIGRNPMEPRMLDLPNAIATLRHAAGWADKLGGAQIPTSGYLGKPTVSYSVREPVGVVGAIVPWNTPFMITCWKLSAALAAGCSMVIKPAEQTPLSALHLAALCQEAGFPDGVVNVVLGEGRTVGAALCVHPKVAKVTFTGSTEVGAHIQRTAGPLFKRIGLELGGKSPQIVFEDARLEQAVQGCAMGIFFNAGQVCAAGSRVLVQRSLVESFSAALAQVAASITVGENGQMGALASKAQYQRVNAYIRSGIEQGALLLAGGPSNYIRGYFPRPTVFGGVRADMRIAQEEIFGPVVSILAFETEDEAIALANGTEYGLGATVWTRDVARAQRIALAMRAGAVGINCWSPLDPALPWGGVKASGLGRECGQSGVLAYTEEKVITTLLE